MKPVKKTRESVNKYLIEIARNYFQFSSKQENMFDIGVPVIISVCISSLLYLFEPSLKNILAAITSVNTVALAVIAILAGFNTSSLALVATANKEALQKLYVAGAEPQERNVLKQVITFFAFAILIQIAILIVGTVFGMVAGNIQGMYLKIGIINREVAKILLLVFGTAWLAVILYSLFISLRNISLLYKYVLYLGRNS